jgi:hypothetical protein
LCDEYAPLSDETAGGGAGWLHEGLPVAAGGVGLFAGVTGYEFRRFGGADGLAGCSLGEELENGGFECGVFFARVVSAAGLAAEFEDVPVAGVLLGPVKGTLAGLAEFFFVWGKAVGFGATVGHSVYSISTSQRGSKVYNLSMEPSVVRWLVCGIIGLLIGLLVTAACFGVSAYRRSDSPQKFKTESLAHFLACIAFGSAFCLVGLGSIWLQWKSPTYQVDGIIDEVQVHGSRDRRTTFRVQTQSESDLQLNADGTSPYFRSGEHIKASYQGWTGSIKKAQLLSPTGSVDGVFNGTDWLYSVLQLVFGSFFIWAGFRKKSHKTRELSNSSV